MNRSERILEAATAQLSAFGGKLGFAFEDLGTGVRCSLHGDEAFPLASAFKVFLLTELFRQAEEGKLSLDETITVHEGNLSAGSGILGRFRPGTPLSLYNHAVLMMALSDNTSTDLLFERVGRENIRKNVLRPLGLSRTKVDLCSQDLIDFSFGMTRDLDKKERLRIYNSGAFRNAPYLRCETELNDCSSPEDMAALLRAVYEGRILSEESARAMLALMRPIPQKARIEKYLPAGVTAARKTGSLDRVCNDVGIVYTAKGAYSIVLLYNGNVAGAEEYARADHALRHEELLACVSKAVYDAYMLD